MSAARNEDVDVLVFDVPTTDADREALRKARNPPFASFGDYLRWLGTLPVDRAALAARKLPIGHRPFSLFDPPPVADDEDQRADRS